jgi:PAS domain S-box-containing protein
LAQIVDAHEHYGEFGETGEFTLAKREGDNIVFLLRHRHFDLDRPKPVSYDSDLAEPMRRALSGMSGTVVGLDYRGVLVLAAHEPVGLLGQGIVAKIDLSEIRAPFVKAGTVAAFFGLLVITGGAGLFLRVSQPMIRRLEEHSQQLEETVEALRESEEKYRSMMEAMNDQVYICSPDFRVEYMNPVMVERTGRDATGEPCHKAINDLDEKCPWCVHEKIQQGERVETEIVSPQDGRFYNVSHSPILHVDGSISKMTIFRDITEQKRTDEALRKVRDELERRVEERTEELRQVSAKLLYAHEEESKRIGQELHDGLAQTLSAVKVWGEAAVEQVGQERNVEVLNSLEKLISLAQGAVEEVRRISLNLRPSLLDDLGLLAAISWLCNNFEATHSGIGIEKRIDIQENDVPEPLKIIIFRISQEALNNIGKHSQANLVHFSLKKIDGNKIELTITDNGTGFELDHVRSGVPFPRGLGLDGMKERAELLGGSFSMESGRGTGTTVRASWVKE